MSKAEERGLRSRGSSGLCSLSGATQCPHCPKVLQSLHGLTRHLRHCHQSLLRNLLRGTELTATVARPVVCCLCWLRVNAPSYPAHLKAHLATAMLDTTQLRSLIS